MDTNITPVESTRSDFTVALMLARLLERLDNSAVAVDAAQYQSVVRHLAAELEAAAAGPMLQALLDAHPAAAELYENLNYRHAGLCRSPLEASLNAELRATEVIQRVLGRRSRAAGPAP